MRWLLARWELISHKKVIYSANHGHSATLGFTTGFSTDNLSTLAAGSGTQEKANMLVLGGFGRFSKRKIGRNFGHES